MKKGRKTGYECWRALFICSTSPIWSEMPYGTFSFLFSFPFLGKWESQALLGGKRFHHPAKAGIFRWPWEWCSIPAWSVWMRPHGKCHGSCESARQWVRKSKSEDSHAERRSCEWGVTEAPGGLMAASCYLTGNRGDARGLQQCQWHSNFFTSSRGNEKALLYFAHWILVANTFFRLLLQKLVLLTSFGPAGQFIGPLANEELACPSTC